jgi:uncharacterized protein YecE (DUF72 family)
MLRIGTAGWSIPRTSAASFPTEGTHLRRYSQTLTCAEINSTFYRPHLPRTYAKWAVETPEDFLFSIKAPKTITHESALAPTPSLLKEFLAQSSNLGEKRGPILFQLPPKQAFDPTRSEAFLTLLRDEYHGPAVFEPRHETWFTPEAESLFQTFQIARAAADPPRVPAATQPAGDRALTYYRLHGSPRIYYSSYSHEYLDTLSKAITSQTWVIFDNTASGAATENALCLKSLVTTR